jgi:hypothetical protein
VFLGFWVLKTRNKRNNFVEETLRMIKKQRERERERERENHFINLYK